MLTHSTTETDISSAISAGAKAYLSKNILIEDLIKIISLVCRDNIIISNPMAARILVEVDMLDAYSGTLTIGNTKLSKREQIVLSFVAKGLTNKEIAAKLSISENTAKVHLRNVMEKLGAHTRQEAVANAIDKAHISGISLAE